MAEECEKHLELVPGTTSKILWHFTGGHRLLDSKTNKRAEDLKSPPEAFDILKNILESGQLKVGQEAIPFFGNAFWQRFCSVAEIPIQHLQYHSVRYGKFALGFHRKKLLGDYYRFRPVHYVIEPQENEGDFLRPAWDALYLLLHHVDLRPNPDKLSKQFDKHFELDWPSPKMASAIYTLLNFVKFFSLNDFQTVYCEREWRKSEAEWWKDVFKEFPGELFFKFEKDIQDRQESEPLCMIVCPREPYARNIRDIIWSSDELRPKYAHVPVIAFEDLVEN